MEQTLSQYDYETSVCRNLYEAKLKDYGCSWRIMRPSSITDQLLIKARRIRTLQQTGVAMVDEDIQGEFRAIVNYALMGLIQLDLGASDKKDLTVDEALMLYDNKLASTRSLMIAKNHDYGEAWRDMRVSSLDDMILMKIERTREIESNKGHVKVSEGIDANYQDMVNYAVFALIKLTEGEKE